MTEAEQKSILAEVALLSEGTPLEVHPYSDLSANYQTKEFITRLGVAVWYGNEIIAVVHNVAQWQAFRAVAAIITEGSKVNA